MNPLLYKEIHFQSVKYIMNWTVHGHKCLFSFLFFHFPSNWEREREREREREYTKFGIRRNNPKVTYLIFRRGSTGESFFFYGLIDFRLFLILAWRKWLLRVSNILSVFFTRSTWLLVLSPTNPAKQLTFFFSISADGRESPLPF